ncbi:MAG: IS110 family transposase [Acidimicrobiales bacterium]
MAISTIAHYETIRVIVGVDTHRDAHVAVAIDQLGRRLDDLEIPTTPAGYQALLDWAEDFGEIDTVGVEGTNSYGAGLTRALHAAGVAVVEVVRPNRQKRRLQGKSDPLDAEHAARAVLAGEAVACPRFYSADNDTVEMIRVLRVARRTAMRARTQAINALRALIVTAPDELRQQLRALPTTEIIDIAVGFGSDTDDLATTTKTAMGSLARRYHNLDEELTALDAAIAELTTQAAPELVAVFGVGTETASTLLVTAGANPNRLKSEAAFAMLCGVAPLPASSGQTTRYRLNRSGDRQANAALHRIALVRMRWHQDTRDYVNRRTKEGKTKREIIRCIKRYIAREIYQILKTTLDDQ